MMTDELQNRELRERVVMYREMEREVTDPLARGLLREIVLELEAALRPEQAALRQDVPHPAPVDVPHPAQG